MELLYWLWLTHLIAGSVVDLTAVTVGTHNGMVLVVHVKLFPYSDAKRLVVLCHLNSI